MSISFSAEGARSHTPALVRGMRDGVPIGLGYLAVAFSLGIAARNAGLNAFQGFLVSLLNNASAGEYAGFTTIAADASYLEIAVVTLIANARYLLMSCSLSQKFAPGTPMRHRLLVGYDVTDELFGLAISCDGWLDPYYMYGAILVAAPSWAVGTALGVVYAAAGQGKVERVYADETRPVGQGARLTSWELARAGVPCTLVCDNMAASLMAKGEVDAVIVGADRIAANGDAANKIGTYGVAVLARHHGIPFYVAAPISTIDPAIADGSGIPIEERDASEVLPVAIEGVDVWNPAFDVTPAGLITRIVTERGAFEPDKLVY